jgi:hypothetical protein
MKSYSHMTDYNCNKLMTRNHTGVSFCHYCHYCNYCYCRNEQYYIICNAANLSYYSIYAPNSNEQIIVLLLLSAAYVAFTVYSFYLSVPDCAGLYKIGQQLKQD